MDTAQFTQDGLYLMLALDHRGSFRKLINEKDPDSVTTELAQKNKSDIIDATYKHFTGVLVDFDYGLGAYQSREEKSKPFLLPAEKTGYSDEKGERITEIEFTAPELKNLKASGVKLLIYFNPKLTSAFTQMETAKKVIEDAHRNELPVFLEIVTYESDDASVVYDSVEMFIRNGVIPDVFKIEYPGSKNECAKITEILGEIPWIILTRAASFEVFTHQLRDAIQNGCKGFLAGRSIWQEYPGLKDPKKREHFLKEILPIRFEGICKIARGEL